MAKTSEERVKDLYLVSAVNPEKELNLQKSLIDQKLKHEDVLLLKTRKKKKHANNKRLLKLRKPSMNRTGSLGSFSSLKGSKGLQYYIPPIIFYPMRWIEYNGKIKVIKFYLY